MPPTLPKTNPIPLLRQTLPTTTSRLFTTTQPAPASGDTGAPRPRGESAADSWTRREKAAEDMYIKAREREIMALLKEKIEAQEKKLEIDREVLRTMQDQYGHAVEERQ